MKKLWSLIIFTTLLSFNSFADCTDYNYDYKSCSFKIENIKENEQKVFNYKENENNFEGSALVKCLNGKNIIIKETCEYKPKLDLGDCSGIKENNWSSGNNACHHNDLNRIIKNNDKLNIKSDTNNGNITYQCDNGKIKVESTDCNSISKTKNIGLIESKSVVNSCGLMEKGNSSTYWDKAKKAFVTPSNDEFIGLCNSICKSYGHSSFSNNYTFKQSGNEPKNPNYIDVSCDCCDYVETTPTTNCVDSVTPIDSNSATIKTCQVFGSVNSSTGEADLPPSNQKIIDMVCKPNGYNNLNKKISVMQFENVIDIFTVVAECSGKTTQDNNDPCRGNFIGDLNTAKNSGVPFNCENNQCWIDLCSNLEMDKDLCKDCGASSLTWADSDKIGDCTANLPNIVSGQSVKVPFFNNNYNGNVTVSCNAGDKSVLSSNCWNNCKGGVKTWGKGLDRAGNSKIGKCSFDFANANYKNGDIVSPTTSINNNGTSSFKCVGSNGQWSNTSDICNIDCPTNISWENGKCSDVVASSNDRDHGDTASLVSKDTFNKGTANATCNDGKWDLSNEICNEGCNAGTIAKNWSSCSGSISVVKSAHGTLSAYFANNNNNYNGQARLKCNDTSWDLQDTTCNIKTCGTELLTWSESHPWGTETCSAKPTVTNVGQNKTVKDSLAYSSSATFNCVVNGTSGTYVKASGSCSINKPIDEVCAWKRNTTGSCNSSTGKRTYNEVFARVSAPQYGGLTCLEKYKTATNTISTTFEENCAVNCVGSWVDQSWESCKSTNEQSMIEKFIVTVTAKNGGAACSASNGAIRVNTSQSQSCVYNRNCVGSWVENGYLSYGNWTPWSSCVGNTQTRKRTREMQEIFIVTSPAQGNGTCEASHGQIKTSAKTDTKTEVQSCTSGSCPVRTQLLNYDRDTSYGTTCSYKTSGFEVGESKAIQADSCYLFSTDPGSDEYGIEIEGILGSSSAYFTCDGTSVQHDPFYSRYEYCNCTRKNPPAPKYDCKSPNGYIGNNNSLNVQKTCAQGFHLCEAGYDKYQCTSSGWKFQYRQNKICRPRSGKNSNCP